MFVLTIFSLLTILLCITSALIRSLHHDVCGEFDGRRMYLELGEKGILVARNQNKGESNHVMNYKRNSTLHRQCSLEIITCPSCIISIQFSYLNVSYNCDKSSSMDNCCEYVLIFELYEEVSGEQFCGEFTETSNATLTYTGQTRSTTIRFVYNSDYNHAFTLKYFSAKNRQFIGGYPNISEQYLTSPFFPKYYPRDTTIEYVINCKSKENCKIRLIFTDFQISRSSVIEFYDWNGNKIFITTGSLFRPPILVSSGSTMVVKFYANGGTNLGYKAIYSFLLEQELTTTKRINTDCGGYIENLGGGITMMDMVDSGTVTYDCFWIIKTPQTYLHIKTHLYVKVTKFEDFEENAELIIREGLTTNGPILEKLQYPLVQYSLGKLKEHIIPISEGFYISMKGSFRSESKLEIIYAAISYKDCSTLSNFLCNNKRCISTLLYCDGFDNCGDNSDEPHSCAKEQIGTRRIQSQNFYFPKSDRFFDLRTATIVFVICSLALISLIVSLIILLYRMNVSSNNHRTLQTHLQAINDFLESTSGLEEEDIIIDDIPPTYEPPPNYDDVIKPAFEGDIRKFSKKRKYSRRSCSRCNHFASHSVVTSSDVRIHHDSAQASGSSVNLLAGLAHQNCQSRPTSRLSSQLPPVYDTVMRNVSKDREKMLALVSQKMTSFEGAKHLLDSLGIDLPVYKTTKVSLRTMWLQKENVLNFYNFSMCKSMYSTTGNRRFSDSELFYLRSFNDFKM